MHTTPRLGLDVPDSSDNESAYPADAAQSLGILDNAVTFSQGTLASLPVASLAGRRYYATDIGQELYDTGSSWISVGSATPIGALMQYGGSADPVDPDGATRWLICDGRAISRSTYSRLFTALSTTYGSGNGSTTFNIPDLRGRVAVGADSGGVHLSVNHPALGASGGEEKHTLSSTEMPSHQHNTVNSGGYVFALTSAGWIGFNTAQAGSGSATFPAIISGTPTNVAGENTSGAAGGGSSHNNLQPYLAVNHIVKAL